MTDFELALRNLINCHSMENASNTPDFVLANYLIDSLNAYNRACAGKEAFFNTDHFKQMKHDIKYRIGRAEPTDE